MKFLKSLLTEDKENISVGSLIFLLMGLAYIVMFCYLGFYYKTMPDTDNLTVYGTTMCSIYLLKKGTVSLTTIFKNKDKNNG